MTPTAAASGYGDDARDLAALAEGRPAPATVLALARPGRQTVVAGRGDAGDGLAPDAETAFRIASCTKSFTAARVLQLRDAGRIDLDDPVDRLLPAPPRLTGAGGTPVTVRMAMSMAAGLPTDDAWADRQESISAEALDAIGASGVRAARAPGVGYEYSNLGYAWLGRICERVDGRPFVEQVRDELLVPLGLSRVSFSEPGDRRVATGYARAGGAWQAQAVSGPGAFSAIGGLFASVSDLDVWSRWLLAAFDGEDADADAILSAASRREMQRPQTIVPAAGGVSQAYGFGLVIEADPRIGTVVSHSGGYPGFSSHMRWHPASGISSFGLENARYSGVRTPVAAALVAAVEREHAGETVWPETREAVRAVARLLADSSSRAWSEFLDASCDPVVALDESSEHRERRAAELIGEAARSGEPRFPTAASAEWEVEGRAGRATVSLELGPAEPPRIQRLDVSPSHA